MAGRRTKLTHEVHSLVVGLVSAGAFAHVAARSAGIAPATYHRWLDRGRQAKFGIYREFSDAIHEAHARARAGAEIEVRRTNPLSWLRLGPGRSQDREPGWTEEPITRGSSRRIAEEIVERVAADVGLPVEQVARITETAVALATHMVEMRGEPW